jgi:S-DNA-T family DNA segregation ATPase FtsK/SpoIIIE
MADTFNFDLALTDDEGRDAETVTVFEAAEGEPVDEPSSTAVITWSDVTRSKPGDRPPLIPAWMRSRKQRVQTMKQMGQNVAYYVAFHALRSPKYLAKTMMYSPRGLGRTIYRLGHWAAAEEGNFSLRQHAANTNDAHTFLALNKTRAKESSARWWVLALIGAPAMGALLVAWVMDLVPSGAWEAAAVLAVPLLARLGRPADKAIIDRVAHGRRFTKLTAEMVREALLSLGLTQMKEPSSVEFVHPGIHRDGPGWLARVNLPAGLEAVKVLERRGALSSALRLPVDQVWPSAGPDHAGQLDLWVGYQAASKMGQPRWSLSEPTARTSVFEAYPFGTDERQRPISITLF